jgi:hypothetical protein
MWTSTGSSLSISFPEALSLACLYSYSNRSRIVGLAIPLPKSESDVANKIRGSECLQNYSVNPEDVLDDSCG